MQNLLNTLTEILAQDDRLVMDGKLLKNKVIELALAMDPFFLRLLIQNESVKNHFFTEIDGMLVFDKIKFQRFVSNKEFLPDSYTAFKNKIGLVNERGEYIADSHEVVLAWPYKDCILEGGQTKEDQKRDEIFWNEILAPDEIDRLLSPKVFTNWKVYDAAGEHVLTGKEDINFDTENIIIRGNNLLALHSIEKRFAGKIKLIYIDPPFNTDNDSFSYNDSFNHSTWLTFMKNRLEIAKKLLSDKGSIYIQLDYNEVHYCKVLMDSIFGAENFQREIIWRIGWVSGYKTKINNWIRNHDTILFYSKNADLMEFNKKYIPYPEGYVRRDGNPPDGKGFPVEDTWNCSENDILNSIQLESFNTEKTGFITQKNENLIQRIVEASSNKDEYVMDFCLGAGTTAAVCHKLNRKYIGIEQMEDQIITIIDRLKKVVDGRDDKGISKSVNWKGGGSLIYCEIKQWNELFISKILNATCNEELYSLWNEIQSKAFISYKVDPENIDRSINDYYDLSFEDKKRFLIEVLDKNQLLINYSEIEDTDYQVSDIDKTINSKFYNRM